MHTNHFGGTFAHRGAACVQHSIGIRNRPVLFSYNIHITYTRMYNIIMCIYAYYIIHCIIYNTYGEKLVAIDRDN